MFKTNQSVGERAIRISLGVILLALGSFYPIFYATPLLVLGAIGLVPFITGAVGWCPIKKVLGISPGGSAQPAAG